MKYNELLSFLKENADEKYAAFSKSLSNSDYEVIGIRAPKLRSLIKDHKHDEELVLSDFELGHYMELDNVYFGLGLSRANSTKEMLKFLLDNIKYAKSWCITDTAVTYFKKITFPEYKEFFLKTYESKFLYERRMAYVLGLKLYKNNEIIKIESLFKLNEQYMVMMAEAWLLATIAINFPEEIYTYLNDIQDKQLIRKTISKISDSYRIDPKHKEKFKELRKKL